MGHTRSRRRPSAPRARVAALVPLVPFALAGCAGPDLDTCGGAGMLRTVFADGAPDPAVWQTEASVVDGALVLDGCADGPCILNGQVPVALNAPLEFELHPLGDGAFATVRIGEAQIGFNMAGGVSAYVASTREQLTLGEYDPELDAVLVVARNPDGTVRFSTRGADGVTHWDVTSKATLSEVAPYLWISGIQVAVTAIARDAAPVDACPVSAFQPSLRDGKVEEGVEVLDEHGCEVRESADGLDVTVPIGVDTPTCGYGSTRPIAMPARARVTFGELSPFGAEPFVRLGSAFARVGMVDPKSRGEPVLGIECMGARVAADGGDGARSLELSPTDDGQLSCVLRDDGGAVIAEAKAPWKAPAAAVVSMGFTAIKLEQGSIGTMTGFELTAR